MRTAIAIGFALAFAAGAVTNSAWRWRHPDPGPLPPLPPAQYLLDFECWHDDDALTASHSHLVAFNPTPDPAELKLTLFFQDHDPTDLTLTAAAMASSEFTANNWPNRPERRFAARVLSNRPVVCQTTTGWADGVGDAVRPRTRSAAGPREAARSSPAIARLGRDWLYADGFRVDDPAKFWLVEAEAAVILNPTDEPAEVTFRVYCRGRVRDYPITVPPRRLRRLEMADYTPPWCHVGARFVSDRPVAVQRYREVRSHGANGPMTFWSVPGAAGGE